MEFHMGRGTVTTMVLEHTAVLEDYEHWPETTEEVRERLENGTGGDHDVPYRFYQLHALMNHDRLARLAARFQRGEVGGARDGE